MVLMALVDADYKFLYVNVGANGSASDSTVLENTSFWRALEQNKLHLPPAEDKHGYNLPYVFLGDSAFRLRPDFLKPHDRMRRTPSEQVFDYQLSRARRVVENGFGHLGRFRILKYNLR